MNLKNNEIILFQGDSITDGGRGRNADPNHVMGHGYAYLIGARLKLDNIGKNIITYNRGISGNRIADLYGRWIEDTINLKPTVLSILVGINDIHYSYYENSGSNAERYEKIYRLLLNEVIMQNENIKIVLMEPFLGEGYEGEEKKAYFRSHLTGMQKCVRKIADDYGAVFVPLQDMLSEYERLTEPKNIIWDGVHPTDIGHELIARQWIRCVERHS